jgi:hypothetical protein
VDELSENASQGMAPKTMERLQRGIEAFEKADPLTRAVILTELLGTAAKYVETEWKCLNDEALKHVLSTLESKLAHGKPN